MSTTGDRLIRVFTDRPPVRMSTVTCTGCGHSLDVICGGFHRTPDWHNWNGTGTTRGYNHTDVCPVDSNHLATLIARAQVAQQAEEAAA